MGLWKIALLQKGSCLKNFKVEDLSEREARQAENQLRNNHALSVQLAEG